MIDHVAEIIADSGVVRAEETIGFAGAAAAIPGKSIPSSFLEGQGHSSNILGGRFTLKPVPDDSEAFVFAGRPVQVHEVAIGQLKALAIDGR